MFSLKHKDDVISNPVFNCILTMAAIILNVFKPLHAWQGSELSKGFVDGSNTYENGALLTY